MRFQINWRVVVGALTGALLASGVLVDAAQAAPSLGEPSLSPDGSEVVFVSGGDIWTAPAQGGTAHLLVSDPATESRPIFSPDGARLAFMSNRGGTTNIYLLTLATGEVKRLTWADANEQLDGWSRDGKWVYFASAVNDVGRQDDIFRVSADGGTPLEVSREVYLNEFQSAASPDGKSIALMAKGLSNSQWWRNGHSHIDETELWLKPIAEGAPYTRVLAADAKHAFPMWRPDGAALYYMSDESGAENIWTTPLAGGAPTQITHFTDGRVLWPSIGYDGRAIVFERNFGIWILDTATGQASQIQIALRGAPASEGLKHMNLSAFNGLALSPDGKKVAVVGHGQVFAGPSKDGGPAQRISHNVGASSSLVWSPDSRRLTYVSERGLDSRLVQYDFARNQETDLTKGAGVVYAPAYAPDGKSIAYVRGDDELHVLDLAPDGAAQGDRLLFKGALEGDGGSPTWSPDSKFVAFVLTDHKAFRNIQVVPAAGGEARPITFLANGNTGGKIAWSPDGRFIIFDTSQRSEDAKLVRVDLIPHLPKYREDAFQELFKSTPDKTAPTQDKDHGPAHATPPADHAGAAPDAEAAADDKAGDKPKTPPKPVKIVFDGIRERATILPLGMSAERPLISPDGKTLIFAAQQGQRQNLYSYSLDELAVEPPSPKEITSTEHPKVDYAFTPDDKTVFYRDGDRVFFTALENPSAKPLPIAADLDVDFNQEKQVVFDEAWGALDRHFVNADFNGQDWVGLHERFEPQIEGAHTGDELRRLINLMIGELNSSHSGIGKPGSADYDHVGDLGLRFEREPYEAGKGLVIRQVIELGPSAIEGSIKPGERLVAIDGAAIGPHDNLDQRLVGKVGRRTTLTIAGAGGATREVVVRPVTTVVAAGLVYRQWVNGRRAYVDKISGGRLGYVHIPDMSEQSLAQLYIDLDAQNQGKQGVVVDIRNNNGGYINGYALDVFTRRNYLTMTLRGEFPVPSRSALGQRALGVPTVLVTNESSLSDAEDFTEGYRSLGLGKVVGEPTAGWIIFTDGQQLIDGSAVRLPETRIQDMRGQTMEMHPRPVDVEVARPLGESQTGHDAQLDAAVKTLLDQLQAAH
jgi:Tol biopolymer transport system component/C-terminal processing protease CtpA/Prc